MKKLIIIILFIFFTVLGIFLYRESRYNLYTFVSGESMVEYGLNDGQKILYNDNAPCKVGDFCIYEKGEGKYIVKKLVSINNDCYWFEGNPSGYKSSDSRSYGCLTKDEFNTIGVVKPNFDKKALIAFLGGMF